MMSRSKESNSSRESLYLVNFFAKRYLFSKKSHSLVNTISIISSFSVAIPVAAIIILMSVFGGINSLIETLNSSFDADIKVSIVEGRFFQADSVVKKLSDIKGVEMVTSYIEDNALANYGDAQTLVTVRGVDTLYRKVVPIDSMMKIGEYSLGLGDINYAVVGMGVAYNLGVNINMSTPLQLFVPSDKRIGFIPMPTYRSKELFPNSIFMVDADTDGHYVLTPLNFAQQLFRREGEVTAVAVKCDPDRVETIKKRVAALLGDDYRVENRYEQKKSIYNIMESEKKVLFYISMLVVLIASFSLTGSLVMLMADKRQQMVTLKVMGASERFIDKIFLLQGGYISSLGILMGIFIGVGVTLIQKYGKIIKIESETLLIDSYPVVLSLLDVSMVVISVVIINSLIIFATVKSRTKI